MRLNLIFTGFMVSSMIALTSCNDEENNLTEGKGTINVHLTDAPFPIELVNSAWITVDKVEIRSYREGESEDSAFLVINDKELHINLLELTNGITEQIAFAEIETGLYDLIRLHINSAKIILNDGSEFNMKVPSGAASGIKVKLKPGIVLEADQTTDVLLDFDVSRSFVAIGELNDNSNFKGFSFKPVVRGVFLGTAGRIEGNVIDETGIAIENIMVSTWIQGENADESEENYLASTFTDELGNYKLIGLPEGTYSVLFASDDFGNDTIKDVTVSAGNSAEVDFGY